MALNQIPANCTAAGCKNGPNYFSNGAYLCGTHCRNQPRVKVDKSLRPSPAETPFAPPISRGPGNGLVALTQIKGLFGKVDSYDGYLKIFPNYKHGDRKDGIGLPDLSPMRLGPVVHGQKDRFGNLLPPSLNLENFHQANKVFAHYDIDPISNQLNGNFYAGRVARYLDSIPHRHKYDDLKKAPPLYSIWSDSNSQEHIIDYVTSRQFYCNFYERLTRDNPSLLKLREFLANGYCLQICGYDAYPIELKLKPDGVIENISEAIDRTYLDPTHPFGHERVLMTILLLHPEQYPWRKYKTFEF